MAALGPLHTERPLANDHGFGEVISLLEPDVPGGAAASLVIKKSSLILVLVLLSLCVLLAARKILANFGRLSKETSTDSPVTVGTAHPPNAVNLGQMRAGQVITINPLGSGALSSQTPGPWESPVQNVDRWG